MNPSSLKLITFGALVLAAFIACGDDDATPDPEEFAGPPSIRVSGFIGADWRVTPRSDETRLEVCADRFGVVVEIPEDTWLLRPVGRCGNTDQCGYIELSLDPDSDSPLTQRTMSRTTMLSVAGTGFFAEGGAGGEGGATQGKQRLADGRHRVRAELKRGDGTTYLLEGAPVADEVELELAVVPCSSSNQPGLGGMGGQPGAGGEPSG